MSLAHAFNCQVGLASVPNITPVVFVIDDDIRVRDSLELLIRRNGWQPETFASAQEFFARLRPIVPNCLILALSFGSDRFRSAKTDCPGASGNADYRYFWLRRCSNHGRSYEGWCRRFSREALSALKFCWVRSAKASNAAACLLIERCG